MICVKKYIVVMVIGLAMGLFCAQAAWAQSDSANRPTDDPQGPSSAAALADNGPSVPSAPPSPPSDDKSGTSDDRPLPPAGGPNGTPPGGPGDNGPPQKPADGRGPDNGPMQGPPGMMGGNRDNNAGPRGPGGMMGPGKSGPGGMPGGMMGPGKSGPGGMGPGGMGMGPGRGPMNDPEMLKLVQEDMSLEQQARDLATKYQRATTADRPKIKEQITEVVNKQFDVRQQRRSLELKRLEEELKRLRDVVERREKARKDIVEKRVTEIVGPEDSLDF